MHIIWLIQQNLNAAAKEVFYGYAQFSSAKVPCFTVLAHRLYPGNIYCILYI